MNKGFLNNTSMSGVTKCAGKINSDGNKTIGAAITNSNDFLDSVPTYTTSHGIEYIFNSEP